MTYRFRAHSMYDPERYRAKAEVTEWRQRDLIDRLHGRLQREGMLDDAQLVELERQISEEIDDAVAFAEAAEVEPVENLTRYVYSDRGSA